MSWDAGTLREPAGHMLAVSVHSARLFCSLPRPASRTCAEASIRRSRPPAWVESIRECPLGSPPAHTIMTTLHSSRHGCLSKARPLPAPRGYHIPGMADMSASCSTNESLTGKATRPCPHFEAGSSCRLRARVGLADWIGRGRERGDVDATRDHYDQQVSSFDDFSGSLLCLRAASCLA